MLLRGDLHEPRYDRTPPWAERRAFTLMELLRFDGGAFSRISGVLAQAWTLLTKTGGLPSSGYAQLGSALGTLETECETLHLTLTLVHLKRFLQWYKDSQESESDHQFTVHQLTELQTRLIDELNTRFMVAIPSERIKYYKGIDLFGGDVPRQFRHAAIDIEEAGKCLALNRNTACVFHLMRVMETGLRALAKSLNDPRLDPARNPSWETILRKGDEELLKPITERSIEWRSDHAFFSTAVANLRAVKDAWRNTTMHVEQNYSDETALEVWNAVRAFMRHLATKLGEAV